MTPHPHKALIDAITSGATAELQDPVELSWRKASNAQHVIDFAVCYGWEHIRIAPGQPEVAEPDWKAEAERAQRECDAITKLNHAQWLALENVRTLAARHRQEPWAIHMLRFCEQAGNRAQTLRSNAPKVTT